MYAYRFSFRVDTSCDVGGLVLSARIAGVFDHQAERCYDTATGSFSGGHADFEISANIARSSPLLPGAPDITNNLCPRTFDTLGSLRKF